MTHGSEIIFPEAPTRPGGEGYSYVFKDWGLKQTIATKDLNFTARFIKVYDEMTVTLLNVDNTVYEIEKCDYDSYINSYEEPEFEKDSNKYYRFLGWYDTETDELFDFDIEMDCLDFTSYFVLDTLYLSKIYELLGDQENAAKWMKIHLETKDKVNVNNKISQEITKLMVSYYRRNNL